jgi:hypothetical protein
MPPFYSSSDDSGHGLSNGGEDEREALSLWTDAVFYGMRCSDVENIGNEANSNRDFCSSEPSGLLKIRETMTGRLFGRS